MKKDEYKKIKVAILRKMLRHEYIGGRHTSIKNIPKGFPKSEKGKVMNVIEQMKKEGYFIIKKKPDSLHISLNPKRIAEIVRELERDMQESEDREV